MGFVYTIVWSLVNWQLSRGLTVGRDVKIRVNVYPLGHKRVSVVEKWSPLWREEVAVYGEVTVVKMF